MMRADTSVRVSSDTLQRLHEKREEGETLDETLDRLLAEVS
jgi:hypothetical protein